MEQSAERHDDITVRYSIIPEVIITDRNIGWGEKILFSDILALSLQKGFCYANNRYFCKRYKVEDCTIGRWLKSLEEQNYIKRQIIYDKETKNVIERRIQIVSEKLEIKTFIERYLQNCSEGLLKNEDRPSLSNDGDNNTYMNNTYDINKSPSSIPQNIKINNSELQNLILEFGKDKVIKVLEEYALWKKSKKAHPKSDFNSLKVWLQKKPYSKKKSTSVDETGVDKISEETLSNLPF